MIPTFGKNHPQTVGADSMATYDLGSESTCVHWPDCPRRGLVQAPEIPLSLLGIHDRAVFSCHPHCGTSLSDTGKLSTVLKRLHSRRSPCRRSDFRRSDCAGFVLASPSLWRRS